jgi:S1-C subfamily serine protease
VLGLSDQIETQNSTASNQGSSSGVGFAIASNMIAHIANEIIAGQPVKHAYVGVSLNPESTGGAGITQIAPNSPAASAGLQQNDLVTAINGTSISSTQQFIETVDMFNPGQTIELTVKRGGSTQHIKLTLGTRPNTPPSSGG